MWAADHYHWQWFAPVAAIMTVVFVGLVVISAALWCHLFWRWIRAKGLQLGPAIAIAIGLLIVAGGGVWALFTWQSPEKKAAHRPAQDSAAAKIAQYGATPLSQRGSDTPNAKGAVGARAKDEPGVTIGPLPTAQAVEAMKARRPKPRPASPAPLPAELPRLRRLISYTPPFANVTRPDEKTNVLNSVEIRSLKNVSDETIRVRVTWPKIEIDGKAVMAPSADAPWKVVPQGDAYFFRFDRPAPFPISRDMKTIHVFVRVEYDTIPATGVRISERDLTQSFVWRDADGAIENFDTIDLKEIER